MKKIMVVYTNYGTGHKKAAEALYENLIKQSNVEAEILDILTYARPVINKLFKLHGFLLASFFRKQRLKLYRERMYQNFDAESKFANFCMWLFWTKRIQLKLNEFKPDVVISTQVGPTGLIAVHKEKIGNPKLCQVFTDYGLHKWYILRKEGIDYSFVSTEDIKTEMIELGINEEKIIVSGIPVSTNFNVSKYDKLASTKKYKLDPKKVTILFVAGGGIGLPHSFKYFKDILKNNIKCNIIFVSGKSKRLPEFSE